MLTRAMLPVVWTVPGSRWGSRRGSRKMPHRQRGGCTKNRGGGCHTPPVMCALSLFGFFLLDRPTRTAPAERERTGATPHF